MSDVVASVIVPMRNAGEGANELLELLAAQTLSNDCYEVLVVDDFSRDDTAEIVERSGLARLFRMDSWGGAWAARNVALREARGEVIAFTDADCRPEPDWLEQALAELERLNVDLVAGHIEVPLSAKPGIVELVDFCRFLDQEKSLEEAGFGATANLIVTRAVIDDVGLFNDRSIEGGDVELCLKATRAGYRIAYSPRAIVHHEPRTKGLSMARRAFRDAYGRSQWAIHGGSVREGMDPLFMHPGAWLPLSLFGGRVYGLERLDKVGYRISTLTRYLMALAQWVFIQLPMVAGSIVGWVRERAKKG